MDEPSRASPAILDDAPCPDCTRAKALSRDCPTCHGWGKAGVLIGCPHAAVTRESRDVPMAADLAARGTWPQGRGWLNESASGVAAVRQWWSYERYWKAKLGIRD